MIEALLSTTVALLLAAIVMLVLVLRRPTGASGAEVSTAIQPALQAVERVERALREDLTVSRRESAEQARLLREEVQQSIRTFGESLARAQSDLRDSLTNSFAQSAKGQRETFETFSRQLAAMAEANEKKLDALRTTVDERLKLIQEDNAKKLDAMRETVDEKLQGTLEKRLGESFKLVSERLEQVHKGLGEMQTLASGVGDLKRVLTNVKTRGIWGEAQLENLLEQMLTPEQYDRNVLTKAGSNDRVEFAVRLPGRDDGGDCVWLPIDAKFPQEDYQRLLEAHDAADAELVLQCGAALERAAKLSAKDISLKYIDPPRTTDFAIMFLPTEGLYAEVLRRAGLMETLQREHRVIVAGPMTLAALLNSLQMGFRTLEIQKRSSEVWSTLSQVKAAFGKFGVSLDAVRKKLNEASNKLDDAAKSSRRIEKSLKRVEQVDQIPAMEAPDMLPLIEDAT
jgi:DNA recombination protein RmuC